MVTENQGKTRRVITWTLVYFLTDDGQWLRGRYVGLAYYDEQNDELYGRWEPEEAVPS